MTPGDKERERRIEEIGNKLTNPPTDVQQLLLLLDKADNLLSGVEQCPPQSTHTALRPSMKALISRDLLKHSDLDVKVAVASCLSEITRITAPEAPYDDDLMKEIFGLIVGAFKNLDDMSSRSFSKRVSILETVAKVRSCVLMLDLECDDLILDMFHHFLNTIRSKHSYTIFSSMETVMTLVIEESENISTQLLSCLLGHLKIDDKSIIPSAKKLAEKVLDNSALKLKPCMVELFRDICTLSDYDKVVAAICHGNLDSSMQNETNSGETKADDSKLSDRSHCDELFQGSAIHGDKVVCPEKAAADTEKAFVDAEKVVAHADGSSKSVISNGTFQMGNGDSIVSKQKTELFQPAGQLRDTGGSILTGSENFVSVATRLESGLNLSSLKGRKRKASGKLLVNNHHNQIDDKKVASVITGRRKGRSKEAELSKANDTSFKELETAVCSKPGKMNMLEPTLGLDVTTAISLHISNEHDRTKSRKGRPLRSKPSHKKNAAGKAPLDGTSSAPGYSKILGSQMTNGDLPMKDSSSKMSEVISESKRNILECFASKLHPGCAEDSKTTTTSAICDSEINKHDGTNLSAVSLHIPNDSHGTLSRKGRPLQSKKSGKRNTIGKSAVDGSSSASGRKGLPENSQRTVGALPMSEPSSKKSEVSVSEGKHSGAENRKTDLTTTTCDSETKRQRQRGRSGSQREVRGADFSGQKHVTGTKQKTGGQLYVNDEDKEVKLKELVSLRKSVMNRSINDQIVVKDGNETNSRQKRARGTQETCGMKKCRKSRNELLVGSKIRVWWPEDESFYDAVVDSFDRSSKKHRIFYNDGDVEVLSLNKEKWEPIGVDTKTDGVQEMNTPYVNASKPSNKKARGRHRKAASAETKTVPRLKGLADEPKSNPPLKSNPDSTVKNESNDEVPKRKGRPSVKVHGAETKENSGKGKGYSAKRHSSNNLPNEENVGQSIKRKHSKSGDKAVNGKTRSVGKVDKHTPKRHSKSKEISKSSVKSRKKPMKEGSSRIESTKARRNPGGRPAKGPSHKVRGGVKSTKINGKLKANGIPLNEKGKAGRAGGTGTNGKKRKRGRSGR